MGLWNDIVRRGTTGECRKEDDFPLAVISSLNSTSGLSAIFIGICTTYTGKTDEIRVLYSTGLNFTSIAPAPRWANNNRKRWRIRPASSEQKERWLKTLEREHHLTQEDVMDIVMAKSEGEKILTYL